MDSQYSEEYNNQDSEDYDEYKDDDDEEEEEDEEDCMDKGYYQKRLKNKFFEYFNGGFLCSNYITSNVKDMSKDDDDY